MYKNILIICALVLTITACSSTMREPNKPKTKWGKFSDLLAAKLYHCGYEDRQEDIDRIISKRLRDSDEYGKYMQSKVHKPELAQSIHDKYRNEVLANIKYFIDWYYQPGDTFFANYHSTLGAFNETYGGFVTSQGLPNPIGARAGNITAYDIYDGVGLPLWLYASELQPDEKRWKRYENHCFSYSAGDAMVGAKTKAKFCRQDKRDMRMFMYTTRDESIFPENDVFGKTKYGTLVRKADPELKQQWEDLAIESGKPLVIDVAYKYQAIGCKDGELEIKVTELLRGGLVDD